MKDALIIFVRHPELGKVKTRLAKDIGEAAALTVYKKLLQHTHDITIELSCDKYVYYSDSIIARDLWEDNIFLKRSQQGEDLGKRMLNAFRDQFEKDYQKVVIIGSDCPTLTTEIIEQAFTQITEQHVVVGPSEDGGYYLLGLSKLVPTLFQEKAWSTDSVLKDTVDAINASANNCVFLRVLNDIDNAADLETHKTFMGTI